MTDADAVITAAAQAVGDVEQNYLVDADPTGYAALEARKIIRRLATRNQRPQMLHAHAYGHPCSPACLGILPGPPPPTRWAALVRAVETELAR